jgi:hypothetical protein
MSLQFFGHLVALKMKMRSGGPVQYVGQFLWLSHAYGHLCCTQMAVKVEDSDIPLPKKQSVRTTQALAEGGKCVAKYTNADLPQGALENNDWRKKFIPTYEKWLGARAGPWVNNEDKNLAAMQAIWNAVYPHIDYTIEVDGPVYWIVSRFVSCDSAFFIISITLTLIDPTTCF